MLNRVTKHTAAELVMANEYQIWKTMADELLSELKAGTKLTLDQLQFISFCIPERGNSSVEFQRLHKLSTPF
jgi:hypothetical protein